MVSYAGQQLTYSRAEISPSCTNRLNHVFSELSCNPLGEELVSFFQLLLDPSKYSVSRKEAVASDREGEFSEKSIARTFMYVV